MKRKNSKLMLIIFILLFVNIIFAQKEGVYLIEKPTQNINTVIVVIGSNLEDVNSIGVLNVKIYNKTTKSYVLERNITPILNPMDVDNVEDDTLNMNFDINQNLLINANAYDIRVYSSGYLIKKFDLKPINVEFSSTSQACNGAIPMSINGLEDDGTNTRLVEDFWEPIINYLTPNDNKSKMTVNTSWGTNIKTLDLESARVYVRDGQNINSPGFRNDVRRNGKITICIVPENKPTSGDFNISVAFTNPPFSLGGIIKGEKLSWGGATALVRSDALPKSPEDRKIDKNLDLGLSFTSAVKKNSTTNLKERTTQGILDVRFAPIVNKITYTGGPWVGKITPIFLNANIATGKITNSTLSLNRVIFGTEYEFRYIPALKPSSSYERSNTKAGFIDYYRLKFSGNHSSDRDFKQKEISVKGEFQPVWAIFNHPLTSNWKYVDDGITNKKVVKYETFGWEIIPKVGFEFGKTYSRRNPAEAVEASDLVQRIYGGIEMKFDITSRLSIKVEDTLYGRYELKSNRLKNYFKGEVYAPLGNPFQQTTNGLFFTFEKGDAPPFTNTVNVVKFGYRIQSTGWNLFN